jgi:hypothetical protein
LFYKTQLVLDTQSAQIDAFTHRNTDTQGRLEEKKSKIQKKERFFFSF